MKQKGDDYKISAVKYYLNNNDTMDNTCKIFNCKKPSLHRWIQIYKTKKKLQRKPRTAISYTPFNISNADYFYISVYRNKTKNI